MARNSDFQTVHTEGGLLPADQLTRIAASKAESTAPADYDLPPGEKVNEAISQSWARLCKHWTDYQESRDSLPDDQPGTEITNQKWLLPLFRELGYGKLIVSKSPEVDGKTYPITRFHGHLPIHFIGCNIKLDKRSPGVKGAATGTPHGLVQEFLNRSDDHLWAFVSNGRQFRILRDNVALSRQSYIEFDLEGMFDGEVYSDFALLWMVCHVTRTEGDRPELCCLEKWSAAAREHGTRVLENLRNGVERSIEALGRGFISHPANDTLRQKLREGDLDKQALYHQVLRTVYRLLFLFVAEDRNLLHTPDTSDEARDLYDEYYSTRRLRDLAGQIKGSRHGDLWHVLSLTFFAVSGDESAEAIRTHLGLPVLGSRLWRFDETPDILGPCPACPELVERVQLSNDDLLEAVRYLAYVQQERTLQGVNYRDLGSEELGSVYESLLELQPDIHAEARKFELRTVAGSERKTTGSYYTPDSLVQCLLDSALEPVIEDRLKAAKTPEDKQQALLDLKVCDPACGSGHFLIGAAHRIARHLSRVLAIAAGEAEPTPDVYQHALRDVISHCIYGVDINPMAVELCKVSLWLEAIDPGKPLAFLDHHIQCGNSLLGTTPALVKKGIPDAAFKPIEGDDKEVCKQLKKENKTERKGQRRLWGAMPSIHLGNMAQTLANIDAGDDSTPEAIAAKEKHYLEFVSSSAYENARFLADAWCAAFVWPKTDPVAPAITTETIRRIEESPHEYPERSSIREGVRKLADEYHFFHWHLVYPDVFRLPAEGESPDNEKTGWCGGFDCVLGNPPWDRPKPEPAMFFASLRPGISRASTSAVRADMINQLAKDEPSLFAEWKAHERLVLAQVALLTRTDQYPLTATGKFNLGNVFVERTTDLSATSGQVGVMNLSGLATDDSGKAFISDVMSSGSLVSFYDFENRAGLFPGVHRMYKFSAITLRGQGRAGDTADFVFFAGSVSELGEMERHVTFSALDIALLNPLSGNCPVFRSGRDAELVKLIYERADLDHTKKRVLYRWDANPTFLFVMSDHSHLFCRREDLGIDEFNCDAIAPVKDGQRYLPLYESKMFHQFNHRWSSLLSDGTQIGLGQGDRSDPSHVAVPRYWMRESDAVEKTGAIITPWLLAVREVTNASNERTVIASALPKFPVGHNAQVFRFGGSALAGCAFAANLNSFALDFAARTKVGGSHLSSFILRQLPLLPQTALFAADTGPWRGGPIRQIGPSSLELMYSAWDLEPLARDCEYDGPPFVWNEERRFLIRCELDAAFFHLYLGTESKWRESGSRELLEYFPTPQHAVEYIMDTFPIVKQKDEKAYGHYRTKDTILEIYDEMAEVIAANEAARAAGQPATAQYQTRLNPPPGPPTDAAGKFIPYADWTPEIHARYAGTIHSPRHEEIRAAHEVETIQTGQAILDTLAFLYACKASQIDRLFLEVGLLLMRNDSLRKRVASEGLPAQAGGGTSRPRIANMDQFMQGYGPGTGDQLAIDASSGIQMISIGGDAPTLEDLLQRRVGQQAWERAKEAAIAAKRIQEHCSSSEECLEALGVANVSAFSIG